MGDDEDVQKSDLETSESDNDKRRTRIKAMNASTKATQSLRERSRTVADCRYAAISVDVKDSKEVEAVNSFREVLVARDLLPSRFDDYHTLLR